MRIPAESERPGFGSRPGVGRCSGPVRSKVQSTLLGASPLDGYPSEGEADTDSPIRSDPAEAWRAEENEQE